MKVKLATAFAAGLLAAAILGLVGPLFRGRARECRLGDYLVIAPDRQGSPDILLSRMGKPYLGVSKESTMLLDTDGQRVLYQWDRGKSIIAYAGYDAARQAWIENLDFGADGSVDFRKTEISGRQVKQELLVGDRWLEFLKRDGTTGVVLDGKFMSADHARKRLAARGCAVP